MNRTTTLHDLGSPVWTSSLAEHIRRRGPGRATAEDWLAFVLGTAEKGVGKDELRYSGLVRALTERHGARDVLERRAMLAEISLQCAMPRLQVVVDDSFRPTNEWVECAQRVKPGQYASRGLLGRWPQTRYVARYRHRSLGWSVALVRHADLFHAEPKWWLVLRPRGALAPGQPTYGFRSAGEAMARATEMMQRQFSRSARPRNKTRWEEFSLTGLGDYAELLIALPELKGLAFYSETHFPGVHNLLVHLRTNVCECDEGRSRVLFLDEVQSDWHAALARLQRDGPSPRKARVPDAPFAREWPLLALKLAVWWARRNGLDGVAWSTPEHHERRWRPFLDPPTVVYRHDLPQAAAKLAKALSLEVSNTGLARRRLAAVGKEPVRWEVHSLKGIPTARAFDTRQQAQRFADLTGAVDRVEVPVLWLRDELNVDRMPLFGVTGAAGLWGEGDPASASAPSPGRERRIASAQES